MIDCSFKLFDIFRRSQNIEPICFSIHIEFIFKFFNIIINRSIVVLDFFDIRSLGFICEVHIFFDYVSVHFHTFEIFMKFWVLISELIDISFELCNINLVIFVHPEKFFKGFEISFRSIHGFEQGLHLIDLPLQCSPRFVCIPSHPVYMFTKIVIVQLTSSTSNSVHFLK